MQKTKRKGCWSCDSLEVICWGKQNNKQRFKCKSCGLMFTRNSPEQAKRNRFVWFREWIIGKQTFEQLVIKSGYSERTLKRYFYSYLDEFPIWNIKPSEKVNLLIDGTYFTNKVCLVLYRDNNIKATQLYRLTDGEWLEEIQEDINNLKALGITIESVTCDGLANIINAVKTTSPETIIQRCLVHIQRETLIWLTVKPKLEPAKELRLIIKKLHKIDSKKLCTEWINEITDWYERNKDFVDSRTYNPETGRYWYTHKNIRKAFRHIQRALPNMFHYLDNKDIPKTSNAIEGFFSHLKLNIGIHRGLSKEHYKNYIKWYLYFKSNEK